MKTSSDGWQKAGLTKRGRKLLGVRNRRRSLIVEALENRIVLSGVSDWGVVTSLDEETLGAIGDEAAERWRATGLTAEQSRALDAINYGIFDLGGNALGAAQGYAVLIDDDAAGKGWFIDATPWQEEEFDVSGNSIFVAGENAAGGTIDLLTTVMHEQGHVLGLLDAKDDCSNLMFGTLSDGERRLPVAGQADGADPGSVTELAFIKLNDALATLGDVSAFQISPDSSRVVYRADGDTDEVFELYSRAIDGSGAEVKLNDALPAGGNVRSFQISADSTRVVFRADGDNDDVFELYSEPLPAAPPPPLVEAISLADPYLVLESIGGALPGPPTHQAYGPVVSADGRYVVFESAAAADPDIADINGLRDVFVRDTVLGTTTLVSVNQWGTASGNRQSFDPVISADGRYVAFSSDADDLHPLDDDGYALGRDVFVRDLELRTTWLVSIGDDGLTSGNGPSEQPTISADGRHVAFVSEADNLSAQDLDFDPDIYVFDLWATLINNKPEFQSPTTLVSISSDGTNSGNSFSTNPVITADGRYIAYDSLASNLDPLDTDFRLDVFVRDRDADGNGIFDEFDDPDAMATILVSVNRDGDGSGDLDSWFPQIVSSDDHVTVAFSSRATNLVDIEDLNGQNDIFLRDLGSPTATLVTVNHDGNATGNWDSFSPLISEDGRTVVFVSGASDLVETGIDTNATFDVYMLDRDPDGDGEFGGPTRMTLLSTDRSGDQSANDQSNFPVISGDGRYIGFASLADDIAPNSISDTNGTWDGFVLDRDADGDGVFDEDGATEMRLVTVTSRPAWQ